MHKTIILNIMVLLLGIAGLRSPAQAQDSSTSAGLLLKNNASVRAEGMGEAQAGVTVDEAGALGFNPAGLYGTRVPGIAMVYFRGLVDESFGMVNFAQPVGEDWAAGASLLYYDGGMFDWNTAGDETRQVPAERDALAALTAAHQLKVFQQPVVLGASLKCLRTTLLNQYSALAGAADLGARCELGGALKDLSLGLAIRNVGTPVKYIDTQDPLPSYAVAGVAYRAPAGRYVGLLLAVDAQYDLDKKWTGNAGIELALYNCLAVRAGYREDATLTGWTAGLGFTLENVGLDYSISMLTGLSPVQRMGLHYTFGADPLPEKAAANAESPEAWKMEALNPRSDMEKIPAKITGIERMGGRIVKVSIDIGSKRRIKPGFHGIIINAAGRPIGGLIIREVEAEQSVGEVKGLGQEIELNSSVMIEKPLGGAEDQDEESSEDASENQEAANAATQIANPAAKPEPLQCAAAGGKKGTSTGRTESVTQQPSAVQATEPLHNGRALSAVPKTGSTQSTTVGSLTASRAWKAIKTSIPYRIFKKIFNWLTRLTKTKHHDQFGNRGGQHVGQFNPHANKKG